MKPRIPILTASHTRRFCSHSLAAALLLVSWKCWAQAPCPTETSAANPWKDCRLVRWSKEMNDQQFDQVLKEVEADLVSPSPHAFDIDIWCRLHLRQHDLDKAAAETSPALKQALGVAPKVYALYDADKTRELESLSKELSPRELHGALIYRELIYNAIAATDFDHGYDLAIEALRTQEPNFLLVWQTLNLYEDDLRVAKRLEDLLATDSAIAGSAAGRALKMMLPAESMDSATPSCRNRVPEADQLFVKAASEWLEQYPGDAGALVFRATHQSDLNGDVADIQKDLDASLASYPLHHLNVGLDELLGADFKDLSGKNDVAGRTLDLRWSVFTSSIPAEQKAAAAVIASSAMRQLSGCGASPRILTARAWVQATLDATPAAYQAPLQAELAELDMASADKVAHDQAVKEARLALADKKDENYTALMMRTLEKADRDGEALEIYRTSAKGFADYFEDYYDAAGTALQSAGTCAERLANWQSALAEYPNATWAMNQLAFTQTQCSQAAAARATLTKTFAIAEPLPDSLLTRQSMWAEDEGLSSLDAERTKLFQAYPRQFRGIENPQPLAKMRPAAAQPQRQLELVAQTPPASQMSRMAESADGTLMAVAESDGVVSLWSTGAHAGGGKTTGCGEDDEAGKRFCPRLLRQFDAEPGGIDSLEFSADGKYLLTASEAAGTVKLWDVASGGEVWYVHVELGVLPLFSFRPGSHGAESVAMLLRVPRNAAPGAEAVSGWSELAMCTLDAAGSCTTASWYSNGWFETQDVGALAWSADGNTLLARVSATETLIVDAESMHLLKVVTSHTGAVYKPDLSGELYREEQGDTVLLKTHWLAAEGKPVTVASTTANVLDAEYLGDGAIRFAVENEGAENAAVGNGSAATAGGIQILEANGQGAAGSAAAVPAAKVLATIPMGEFPLPVVAFSRTAPDRLTIVSSKVALADSSNLSPRSAAVPTQAFAVGRLSGAAKNGIELESVPSQFPPVPNSVAFSADGRELMVGRGSGNGARLDVWDLAGEGRPAVLSGKIATGPAAVVAEGRVWTCAQVGLSTYGMMAYELPDLHPVSTGNPACTRDGVVAAGADGIAVAWLYRMDSARVMTGVGASWDANSLTNLENVKALAVQGDTLAAVTQVELYADQKGKPPVDFCDTSTDCPSGPAEFSAVAVSGDGRYAAAAIGPGAAHTVPPPAKYYGVLVADLSDGSAKLHVENAQPRHAAVTAVAFLPNSTRYAAGTVMGRIFWGDAADPSYGGMIGTENSPVAALSFSRDGRLLAVALQSGSVVLYQAGVDGRFTALAQLNDFADGDWSVVDRATKQYDASHAGNLSDLLWIYGTTNIELDQMIENFYRDRLLPKLLAFDPIPVRASPKLDPLNVDLPPNIRIKSMSPELVLATDGSMGDLFAQHRIRVLVNGSPVDDSEMSMGSDGLLHVAIAKHHTYATGRENKISVYVSGTIDSRGFKDVVVDRSARANQPKQFYAILAGISEYATRDLKPLLLADADARDMALAVARGATHLVGDPSQVHIYLLTSDAQEGEEAVAELHTMGVANAEWSLPTHAHFLSDFDRVSDARLHADDIFLVFLAGHGMVLQQNGQEKYAYPTKEMTDVHPPAEGTYLSEQELDEALKKVGASHTILLFDTCDAGNFQIDSGTAQSQSGAPGQDDTLRVDSLQGLNHDSFDNSIEGLMGAAPDAQAYDSSEVRHGFLTNSLLAGMRDSLDGSDLLAWRWLQDAKDRTWEIARFYGLNQQPQLLGAVDKLQQDALEVAKLPASELQCIPDVEVVPLVGMPLFQRKGGTDDLQLSRSVAGYWKLRQDRGEQGKPAVLYDNDFPETRIEMSGEYSTDGEKLTMDVKMDYGGSASPFAISVPFQAGSTDVSAAVKEIVDKVEAFARQLTARRKPWSPPSACLARMAMGN